MTKKIGTFHCLCERALKTQSASLSDGSCLVAIWYSNY